MRTFLKILCLFTFLVTVQNYLSGQEKSDIKFGKVSPADFNLSAYQFDTAAGAVCIADIGITDFEEDRDWYKIVFKRQLRIKILNKNGFDAATFQVPLYNSENIGQKLEKLKAVTYNLDNGKVQQAKLEDNAVFSDRISKNRVVKKFTLPAVREGSIIEVSYTIESNYINELMPWNFQSGYPCLWSEYQARIPAFFDYIFLVQGKHPYHINAQTVTTKNFLIIVSKEIKAAGDKSYTIQAPVVNSRWVMKDVPAMKAESFVTTTGNYVSCIRFELSDIKEPYTPQSFRSTWNEFCGNLMKREDFGGAITGFHDWLNDDLKSITSGVTNPVDKAKKIYTYVRDNFTCTRYGHTATNTLKSFYKARNGTVGDVNLLLIAMLQNQGIAAEPVILSTRPHGFVNPDYPLEQSFNYVIAAVDIGGKRLFMDAAEPGLAFGRLPLNCYNGHARIVNSKSPEALYFTADTLRESKVTSVIIGVDGKGGLAGTYGSKPGYYESLDIRRQLSKEGMNNDKLLQSFKKEYPAGIELSGLEIDSLYNPDVPVQVRYNIDGEAFSEDVEYFNPMLAEALTDNPFKSVQRSYPVEMPYTIDEMYVFAMDIPAGYEVDELPQSLKVSLNKDDGFFEYLVSKSITTVNLRSRIRLNRANFGPEEYEVLRNFYAQIVKKHSEQIVFKRKK